MYCVESHPVAQLLAIAYSGRVEPEDMPACLGQIRNALAEMKPGFRLLADFSGLEFMDTACGPFLGEIMDLCNAGSVSRICRIVPDLHKDIGLNILSFFHYGPTVSIMTYESLEQAMRDIDWCCLHPGPGALKAASKIIL